MTADTRIKKYAETTAAIATHVAAPKATSNYDRGRLITEHYQAAFDDLDLDAHIVLRDLLTDLHHYARGKGIDLDAVYTSAGEVHDEEVALEGGKPLYEYVVTSDLGQRSWWSENADHAAEQHTLAFPDEPILAVAAKVTNGPRVIATVQPQQWIRDNAVDAGPEFEVDVTDQIEAMSTQERDQLEDNSHESDELYLTAVERGQAEKHSGPFYVRVEESLKNWQAVSCDECHAAGRRQAVSDMDGDGGDLSELDRRAEGLVEGAYARCEKHEID